MGDAGFKSTFPTAGGLPRCVSHPRVRVTQLNAEHCHLDVSRAADLALGEVSKDASQKDLASWQVRFTVTRSGLALGERLVLQPWYSDSTTCLHRAACGVRRDRGSGEWRVECEFDLTPSFGALQ